MSADPTQIDDTYEVVRKLGAGGMGAVFEARHRGTGRRVAVKLIIAEAGLDPAMVARFQREARAAGAIESEHITTVTDSGTDRSTGAPYIAMELLNGEDVERLEQRIRPMPPDLALRIVSQALRGLERAHAAGVIHRDIKPANLFLSRTEARLTLKICDFGIAKMTADALSASQDVALTQTSALLGSPRYMSPEQIKGSKTIDARADIWSMGIVLYQLLSGSTPHGEADTLGLLLLAVCSEPAKSIQLVAPWVTKEIAEVVARALSLDPSARYPTARAMREAIGALLPEGDAISDAMLAPLSDEQRACVAEKAPSVARMFERTLREGVDKPFSGGTITDDAVVKPAAPADAKTGGADAPPRTRKQTTVYGGIAAAAAAALLGFGIARRGESSPAPREAPPAMSVVGTTAPTASTAAAPPVVLPPVMSAAPSASASALRPVAPPPSVAKVAPPPTRPPAPKNSGIGTGTGTTGTKLAPSDSSPLSRDWK